MNPGEDRSLDGIQDAPGRALQAATEYTGVGWKVIPVPSGSKIPSMEGWPTIRLSQDDLPQHFRNGSNIGILLGEPSGGLVDVDLDCAEALQVAAEILPPTGLIHGRPGKPRSHHWYVVATPRRTVQLVDPEDGAVLLELRSTGGQTIVPPSLHPSGEVLEWVQRGEPARVDYADLLARVKQIGAIALLASHWPARGSRNRAALALAGFLLRGGMPAEEAEHLILLVTRAASDEEAPQRASSVGATSQKLATGAEATGAPTLEQLVGRKVVAKVSEWLGLRVGRQEQIAQDPDDPPDWDLPIPLAEYDRPPFPTYALPGWLKEFVEAEALATQTPPDLAAMVALSVCAAAIAKKVVLEVKDGYREPVNLFTATVLAPGNRKSAVYSHATAPLEEYEADEARRMAPQIAEAETRYRIAHEALKKAESEAAKAKPEHRASREEEAKRLAQEVASLKVPVPPRYVVDDCSPERLATILRDQGGRVAVMAPEGDVFDLMAGRYSGNGMPNFGVFLRGHAGDPLRVDRVGRPPEFVKAPALTIGLTVQNEVLRGLMATPQFRGRGLIGRFLFSLPRSPLGSRDVNPPAMSAQVAAAYRHHVRTLLSLHAATDEEGDMVPETLVLDPAGREALLDFAAWLEPQLAETAELGSITDWAGKLLGAVARIAGILHMAECIGNSKPWIIPVSERTVSRAIMIGDYLLHHARAAFGEMGADQDLTDARRLLTWIQSRDSREFTKRQAFEATKGRFKRVSNMEPGLALLEEHGYIHQKPQPNRTGVGRKPSPTYEVNPHLHFQDANLSQEEPGGAAFCE